MTSSIITVTLNPAIDETVTLHHLTPGHVHRATAVQFNAGGKGVNVASCLADWISAPSIVATGLLGTENAYVFEKLFAAKKITDEFLRVPGETRTNIKLAHDGDTTDINLPGLTIDSRDIGRLRKKILDITTERSLVLLAGSVPAGVGNEIYADLTASLHARGARVVLDTSGTPLHLALNTNAPPYCIKPNLSELESLCERTLTTDDEIVAIAKQVITRGVSLVVVSLGTEGSLYISQDEVLRARLPAIRPVSTVGAGDAMVAGIIAALYNCRTDAERVGPHMEEIARLATAFAVAKLLQTGPNLPHREIVEELSANVQITKLEELVKE